MSTDLEKRVDAEMVRRPLTDAEVKAWLRPSRRAAVKAWLRPARPAERAPRKARQKVVATLVRRPVHVITTADTRTARLARTGLRAGYTLYAGYESVVARAWSAATHGVERGQVRAARATKNMALITAANTELKAAKKVRSDLLRELPELVFGLVRVAAVGFALAWAVAGVLGLAIQLTPGGWGWSDWWGAVFAVVAVVGNLLYLAAVLAAWVGGPLLLLVLPYREGKRAGYVPRGLASPAERAEMDSAIDERMISRALARIGNPALNAFFKDGGQLVYVVPPREDGDGTFARIDLSGIGVAAEEIAAPKQRARLAGNLKRSTLETWPTKGDEDAILDLWVADKGKLNAGAGEWPLLHDGVVDAFEGVPFGKSQRGDVVTGPLFECNWLIGGRPGQGKSAGLRTLLLGAALDPTVELWAFIMGESPDFKPFVPRLSRYAMGMDDSVAEAAVQGLRDLLAEMERRGKLLGAQPGSPPKTSRRLANRRDLGLHLIVAAFDEVHELFQHKVYGAEACELAVKLIKRGRKYGIVLLLATQSPTKDSIPRDVTRNVGCGVAFCVADHVANDGLLGSGKFKAGIRATELRFNVDRGVAVTVGLTNNSFELVKGFYIVFEDVDGVVIDHVTPVIARAMGNIDELRHTIPGETRRIEAPDLLRDVLKAMRGEQRPRSAVVLARLIESDPTRFEPWGSKRFSAELKAVGVPVRQSNGHSIIRIEDVQEAVSEREEEDR